MADPDLGKACPTCGTWLEEQRERYRALHEAYEDLQRETIYLRATNSKLRKDRNDERLGDVLKKQADELYDYWRAKLSPAAREFSGARLQAVLARLKAVQPDELDERMALIRRAIDGVARLPYVSTFGRSADGRPAERQVELELICRNEANLTRFAGYAQDETPRPNPGAGTQNGHEPPLFVHKPTPFERVVTALRIEYGVDTVIGFSTYSSALEAWGPCPVHQPGAPFPADLRIREHERVHGAKLDLDCRQGCLPTLIRERLLAIEAEQLARTPKDGTYRRVALLLAAFSPEALLSLSAEAAHG